MSETNGGQESGYKQLSGKEGRDKIAEMIRGIPIAMMSTVASDGSMSSRPMAVQERPDFSTSGGMLWFLTRSTSDKVEEIGHDRHVTLTFAKPSDSMYITLKGKVIVSRDRSKIKELWNPMYKAWFPKGEDDPEIAVLRVDVSEGEYWRASSSKLLMMAKYAVATVTGGSVAVWEAGHVEVKQ